MVRRMVLLDLSAVAAVVGAIDSRFLHVGGHVCEKSFARLEETQEYPREMWAENQV